MDSLHTGLGPSWMQQRAANSSVLMYDQATNSALPVRERLPESLTSIRTYLHFCFLGWTKVTLLVLSMSDSSKHEITPLWFAQQWTQALLRASFRLPRFSTALTQPQNSQFTFGWFCLPANQHRHMLEDTAQKSKTLLKIFVYSPFPIYSFSVSLARSLSLAFSCSPSLSSFFYLFLFWFSNRFLGLVPLQGTRFTSKNSDQNFSSGLGRDSVNKKYYTEVSLTRWPQRIIPKQHRRWARSTSQPPTTQYNMVLKWTLLFIKCSHAVQCLSATRGSQIWCSLQKQLKYVTWMSND